MKPVATDWYKVRPVADGISHIYELYVGDWLRCNIWHVRGRERDVLIDSGMGMRPLKADIAALAERPVTAISSHAHFDHIGGAHEFGERLGHRAEAHIHADPSWANTAANRYWIRAETISALPHAGYDIETFEITPAPLTGYPGRGRCGRSRRPPFPGVASARPLARLHRAFGGKDRHPALGRCGLRQRPVRHHLSLRAAGLCRIP